MNPMMGKQIKIKVTGGKPVTMQRMPGVDPVQWIGIEPGKRMGVKGKVIYQVQMVVEERGACRFDCTMHISDAKDTVLIHQDKEFSAEGAMAVITGWAAESD